MSALGQKQTYAAQQVMSALLPIATAKADICASSCPLYPRKQTCAVRQCMYALGQKRTSTNNYSINSSALAIRVSGTVTPSVLAVFRLTMSSNFAARSMGKFAGGVPFRILSTRVAER
jgi:hypothetical protein